MWHQLGADTHHHLSAMSAQVGGTQRGWGAGTHPANTTMPLIPSGMSVTLSPYRSGGVGTWCIMIPSNKERRVLVSGKGVKNMHVEKSLSTDRVCTGEKAEWSGQTLTSGSKNWRIAWDDVMASGHPPHARPRMRFTP